MANKFTYLFPVFVFIAAGLLADDGTSGPNPPILRPVTGEAVAELVDSSKSPATLVNIWATWCQPCREEFPDVLRLYRMYRDRGFRLLLVSADFDRHIDAAKSFLQDQGVDFVTYIKDEKDAPFIEAFQSDWSGALPASFLYDSAGNLLHFWKGKVTFEEFESKLIEILNTGNSKSKEGKCE